MGKLKIFDAPTINELNQKIQEWSEPTKSKDFVKSGTLTKQVVDIKSSELTVVTTLTTKYIITIIYELI